MSARSRAVPWFGTLGERLAVAEDEARAEDVERTVSAPGFWEKSMMARIERLDRWRDDFFRSLLGRPA